MTRATFLKMLGLAPLLGLAGKLPALLKPKRDFEFTHFMGFEFRRTQLLPKSKQAYAQAFTDKLEADGKLAFTERISQLPAMNHCTCVRHVQSPPDIERVMLIDSDDDLELQLENCRSNTKLALKRYWAQQARIERRLAKGRV